MDGGSGPDNALADRPGSYFAAGESRRAWDWAKLIRPVVIKPRDTNQGCDVQMHMTGGRRFNSAFAAVAGTYGGSARRAARAECRESCPRRQRPVRGRHPSRSRERRR